MFRAVTLGAVQGLTEFIPVSSSGHLVLVPFLLKWPEPGVPFDVAVHLGTSLAVIVYFWRELLDLARGALRSIGRRGDEHDRATGRLALLLVIGSIPAAAAGLLFEGFFEDIFGEPQIVALLLLVTAALLLGGEVVYRRLGDRPRRDVRQVEIVDALAIGVFQALAIAPGISRSGATIVAGMGRGLSRPAAAHFSFLLGLPAILGAGLVQIPDFPSGTDYGTVVAATAVSAAVGFAAIDFLLRYLRVGDLRPFAYYLVAFSALSLLVWGIR